MAGHLFIIRGDLRRLSCDAILIPTDAGPWITHLWWDFLHEEGIAPPSRRGGLLSDFDPPPGWGSSVHTVRYGRTEEAGPEVWLTETATHHHLEWLLMCLDQFVESASATRSPDRRPRLAVPMVGTAAGGFSDDKGAIHGALIPHLAGLARRLDVDVILATWGRKAYSAAQRARRRFLGDDWSSWNLGPRRDYLLPLAERLAEAARNGQLVPFIGAGVSQGAGVPGWSDLLDHLYRKAGGSEEERSTFMALDFRDQATILKRRLDDAGLAHLVDELVGNARFSTSHGLLASLGCEENVTTNYDTLFEQACVGPGSRLAVLPYEPVDDDEQHRWLLKLHGTVDRPNASGVGDLVLTRDDYLGLPARAGALYGLVQAMLMTRHMLFVGYSLADESFHRVVHEVRAARRGDRTSEGHVTRMGTVLTLRPEPFLAELHREDLAVEPMTDDDGTEAEGAHHLEVFLDLVAAMAADVSAFLLDPTYASMLDPSEERTARALAALGGNLDDGPIDADLRRMLRGFGGEDA